jgi:superfamily II DNA or RNA helicase
VRLRPYQLDLVGDVRAAYASGAQAVVMQLATGGGKTATAAAIIGSAVARGRRVVFAAHLSELVEDTHARVAAYGVHAGVVQADRPTDPTAPVQVCSLQTLHARGERPPADLVVLDECHRAMGPTVRAILEAYAKAWHLGLTATPQRADGQPLGDVYERLVCGPSVRELTRDGYLVPCDVIAPPEYQDAGLALDPVDAYQRFTPGQRVIVFASNVAHAEELTARFRERGAPSELVVGDTPADVRQAVRQKMTQDDLRVLVGVGVFIEGFDLPAVEAVILARAFGVTGSFLQAIGRGLRPSPSTGKTKCTVLDLRGAVNLHGLPDEDRVWALDGSSVRRTETMAALRRCAECWAIFRPATRCPRCGNETTSSSKLPRNLNRAEILQRVSALPQDKRDARYLAHLERVATTRMHMPEWRAKQWAAAQFEKRFGRRAAA